MAKLTKVERRAQRKAAKRQGGAPAAQRPVAGRPPGTARAWPYLLPALALAVAVFGQTIGFDFVNWDDDVNVLENRGVTTFDLRAILLDDVIGNHNPLAILSFAVEYALVGAKAGLYHANNLLLHLANVALVFFLGRRLRLGLPAAGLLAALFAVHPMRVESVAWVTERKDVLFAAFYFGALLLYERRRQAGDDRAWHWGVAALFALALLSKIQAVSLPLTMMCLDYLRRGRLGWSDVLAKAPYLAMSLAVGLVGVFALGSSGSLEDATNYTFLERLAVGAYSYTVYLAKSVWPYEMSPLYPYPAELPTRAYGGFAVVALALAAMAWGYLRGRTALTFALAVFTVNVMFMLQVLSAGQGYLADRFTYVGYFGLFWGFAYGAQRLAGGGERPPGSAQGKWRPPVLAVAGIYVLACAVVAFRQTRIWENGGTLWTHVTSLYPGAATAYGNLGQYLRDRGDLEGALEQFDNAVRTGPTKGAYLNSRGKLFFDRGEVGRAIEDYTEGIRREPALAELHINRGAALAQQRRYDEALGDINRGLELEPGDFNGLLNRSLLYYTVDRLPEAVADYTAMLAQRPERYDLWQERGSIRASYGELDEGIADLREALRRSDDPAKTELYREILSELEARR